MSFTSQYPHLELTLPRRPIVRCLNALVGNVFGAVLVCTLARPSSAASPGGGEPHHERRRRIRRPRGVSGHRATGTVSAALRLLTARVMLREGHDPSAVAAATDIPRALVETIVEPGAPGVETGSPSKRSNDDGTAGGHADRRRGSLRLRWPGRRWRS